MVGAGSKHRLISVESELVGQCRLVRLGDPQTDCAGDYCDGGKQRSHNARASAPGLTFLHMVGHAISRYSGISPVGAIPVSANNTLVVEIVVPPRRPTRSVVALAVR